MCFLIILVLTYTVNTKISKTSKVKYYFLIKLNAKSKTLPPFIIP